MKMRLNFIISSAKHFAVKKRPNIEYKDFPKKIFIPKAEYLISFYAIL